MNYRKPTYAPRFIPGPAIVNLSSRALEPKEIQTFEKGSKFSFPSKQVPVGKLVSSLESSVHRNYTSISSPDEVRSCLLNSIYGRKKKSYISK